MLRQSPRVRVHAYLDVPIAASRLALRAGTGWVYPTRWGCLLVGHDDQLAREPRRLFLRCGACGRCTRGWAIGTNPPRVTAARASLSSLAVVRAH